MKRKQEVKKKKKKRTTSASPRHNHVGMTYIFITLSRTVFILEQKEMGYRRKCVWAGGLGALEHQEKRFYSCFILFYFLGGACKYVCATLVVSLLV